MRSCNICGYTKWYGRFFIVCFLKVWPSVVHSGIGLAIEAGDSVILGVFKGGYYGLEYSFVGDWFGGRVGVFGVCEFGHFGSFGRDEN